MIISKIKSVCYVLKNGICIKCLKRVILCLKMIMTNQMLCISWFSSLYLHCKVHKVNKNKGIYYKKCIKKVRKLGLKSLW